MGRKGQDTTLVSLRAEVDAHVELTSSSFRLIELNGMKASDEITEEQSRQASLESMSGSLSC